MTLEFDPDLAEAAAAAAAPPPESAQDWREAVAATYPDLTAAVPDHPDVSRTDIHLTTDDGASILARWFVREGRGPGSAVVHAHGGGMVAGSVDLMDPFVADHVARSGVPFLSVDYRLAPEVRGDMPSADLFRGVLWLVDQAAELGVDPARIALLGESAGGGIAAAAAIRARDAGVVLAKQILIYPMLDDRTDTADAAQDGRLTWTPAHNRVGWAALLGEAAGSDAVSPLAAPARLTDPRGLPPAYIEVGELDLFRDEDIAYAMRLWRAGVSTELHVRPGAPHGFDQSFWAAGVSRRATADRVELLQRL